MSEDPFDSASPAFLGLEDLVGRLLLIKPRELKVRESRMPGQQGKEYETVITDTLVCDGDVTDKIEQVPTVLRDLWVSGSAVVGQLRPKLRTSKMVLGRLSTTPSQTKGFKAAWILDEPTEDDKALARKLVAEGHDPRVEETDPFA
jgi:hypothetical protein